MLSYAIFLFAAPLVLSLNLAEIEKTCQKEMGVKETIASINFKDPSAVSNDAKCYLACVMKAHKTMDDDGKIDKEQLKLVINETYNGDEDKKKKLSKISEECLATVKFTKDKCHNAFEFMKCRRDKE